MVAEMMKLRVMVPNLVGKETVLINVSSSSTVLDLKRLLTAEISGDLKMEDLKLIYLGRLLPDLSLLSNWLLPTHPDGSSNNVERDFCADPCTSQNMLHLKSDSNHDLERISLSTHTLHLAYPPASPFTMNKNSFLLEGPTSKDVLGEQQQAQLAELYITYLSLYWQSVNQSERSDLDPRMSNNNTAPPTMSVPPPAISVPPPATNLPEAYLEVLWGLLTCLLHSFLIIAIIHFYGSLNLVKFVLAFAVACLIIFLGQEALRRDEELVEDEEETDNAEVEELVEAGQQQGGTFAILTSNLSLFFSSVFPEGLHLRV